MRSSYGEQSGPIASLPPRIWRGLRFVAIVWSIAGAFLALHFGLPELTHRLLVAGWIPADLALPDRGSVPVTTACKAAGYGAASLPLDPALAQHAPFVGWKLGRDLGFAAGMANLGRTPEQLAPLMLDLEALATELGVQTPHLPEVRHFGTAFAEYQTFVRADPQCVTAALATRFGEAAAHHYRFGLVVGYVIPARSQNTGALFPAELRHYGGLAGVPEDLFHPLTQEVVRGPEGVASAELIAGIVERLDKYILAEE